MKLTAKDLTAEEKLKLLYGRNFWNNYTLDGKLYEYTLSDGPVGIRRNLGESWDDIGKVEDQPGIAYPSGEMMAQTFDPALIQKLGECLADDTMEKGVDVLLAPGVNIKRSPLCGRDFEYFSEDPFAAGTMGKAYISGIQSKNVGATLKHFCCNNLEFGRVFVSSEVDERTLHEIYLRAFEMSLTAKPWAVMSSYNVVNGVRMSENKELTDVLRDKLGFGDGLLMSDWSAVHDFPAAVKSGLDLMMPYDKVQVERLEAAYAAGEITDADIDPLVDRVLKFIYKCEEHSKIRKVSTTPDERRKVAQKIVTDGAVLLKNNGILPLKDGARIGITGSTVNEYFAGGGSSHVTPVEKPKMLFDTLKDAMPASQVEAKGVLSDDYDQAFNVVQDKDVAIVLCGFDMVEHSDRIGMRLNSKNDDEWLISQIAKINPNTVVVIYGGAAVDVTSFIDEVSAVLYVGYPGERGNEGIADILAGKCEPGGRLSETFAKNLECYPCQHTPREAFRNYYAEGIDVGYRYFDRAPERVRFPFGFGLSYTSFAYQDFKAEVKDGVCTATFTVKNVGERTGSDVPQIYVSEKNPKVYKPVKELRGYEKVTLAPGESKTVSVVLDDRAFTHYDVTVHGFVTDCGAYDIILAKNARDIVAKVTVNV